MEGKDERKEKRWAGICFLIFGTGIVQWAVYALLGTVFDSAGLMYRSWIPALERALLFFVIFPAALIGTYVIMGESRWGLTGRIGAFAVRILCVFFCMAVIVMGMLYFVLLADSTFEKERRISKDVLFGSRRLFLEGGESGNYYKPYGILLKKEYEYYEEPVVLAVLRERYGKRMEVRDFHEAEESGGMGYYVYELSPEGEPDFSYHVVPRPGIVPEYLDDYKERIAVERIKEYEAGKTYEEERFRETEDGEYGVLKYPAAVCSGKEDMEACARETVDVVSRLLEDPLLESRGFHMLLLLSDGDEAEKQIMLRAGEWYGADAGYGASQEQVYGQLAEGYSVWEKQRQEERLAKEAEKAGEAEEDGDWTAPLQDAEGLLTPEGAYEKLYREMFEPEGDSYECTYNAKGNFYGILGEGKEIKEGEELSIRRTVVYDRISKNGKCQLFVAYKEYRDGDGNDRGTVILDFYAVDRESGKVTAGNKTAWAEVASKEYQEATGDK